MEEKRNERKFIWPFHYLLKYKFIFQGISLRDFGYIQISLMSVKYNLLK